MVSLSFLVPTAGRPELRNLLASLSFQMGERDECLIIGDTHDGPLDDVEALVRSYGPRYRYIEHDAGEHAHGHPQMNAGMAAARGDWLVFNDDDDVFVPGCVETIRTVADGRTVPVLFRYLNYYGFLVWVERGLFAENYIGGHCLVCPNDLGRLGRWSDRYAGDWDFVNETVAFYGLTKILWRDEVIAIARPDQIVLDEILRLAGSLVVANA